MCNTGPRYIDLYDMKTGFKRKASDFIKRMRENPFSSEYTNERLEEIWKLSEETSDWLPDKRNFYDGKTFR